MTNGAENAMNTIIDVGIKSNCWNLYDSYGEICVGCGCCSADELVAAKARCEVLLRQIESCENFDGWAEDVKIRKLQEKNVKSQLELSRKELLHYRERIKELEK